MIVTLTYVRDYQEKKPENTTPIVKKGDVVWLDGRGGIIGIVEQYRETEETLFLIWPDNANIFWSSNIKPFSPVKPGDIKVLSPREVLEKMTFLIKRNREGLKKELTRQIGNRLSCSQLL